MQFKTEWEDKDTVQSQNLTFVLEQVEYFDKIHIHQVCGCSNNKTLVFARDANVLYDLNGKVEDIQRKGESLNHFHFIYKSITYIQS